MLDTSPTHLADMISPGQKNSFLLLDLEHILSCQSVNQPREAGLRRRCDQMSDIKLSASVGCTGLHWADTWFTSCDTPCNISLDGCEVGMWFLEFLNFDRRAWDLVGVKSMQEIYAEDCNGCQGCGGLGGQLWVQFTIFTFLKSASL